MPLIQCPGCRAVFNVALDVVGTDVDCPKCETEFVAEVKRAGPRRKKSSSTPVMWAIAGVGAVLVVLAVAAFRKPSRGGETNLTDSTANAATETGSGTTATTSGNTANKDPLQSLVDTFLEAVQHGDDSEFLKIVSFPAVQDALADSEDQPPWRDLNDIDRTLARQAISERFLGDDATREFLRKAHVTSLNMTESQDNSARFSVTFESLTDDFRQEREVKLIKVGPSWQVAGMTAGEIYSPSAQQAEKDRQKVRKRSSFYGEIKTVELLEETTPDVADRMESLLSVMLDLSLGRESSAARREMVAIGKPAIPALLNEIVTRKTMQSSEEIQQLNIISQTLRDITFENMGFTPGSATRGIMGESLDENTVALQKWFGWWERHKDTWTGPEPIEGEEDGDGGF